MSNYYEYKDIKVKIMRGLKAKGWTCYGYKPDTSDAMTDYYNPASWEGIAEKEGFVLVIDNNSNSRSGKEIREYDYSKRVNNSERIAKLTAMMNDAASTINEKASCAKLIEKEREKASAEIPYKVLETFPVYSHGNPKRCNWHIEKDGQIIAKGNGVLACHSYDWESDVPPEVQREKKINDLIAKFENVLTNNDALTTKVVKKPTKVKKVVKVDTDNITKDMIQDGFTFMFEVDYNYGNHKGTKYAYIKQYSSSEYYQFSKLGKTLKPSKRFENNRSFKLERLNEMLSKGHICVVKIQEVTEYVEKTVFVKTMRTEKKKTVKIENTIELGTTETSEQTNVIDDVKNTDTVNVDTVTHDDIVTITLNEEMNGIELRFDSKPSQSIIDDLKAHGFRWSSKQKMWYAKQSSERIAFAEGLNGSKIDTAAEQLKSDSISTTYPNIDIDDLDQYTVSDELQNRLYNSSIFEVDWKTDCKNTFENIQAQAIEVLNKTDNERLIYEIKKYVQSYKKRYFELYTKMLNHKANNPSWAVTGRGGLNVRRYNKMQDRYDNMLRKHTELSNEYEKRLGQFQKRINELKVKNINKRVNNINELPVFETTRDNVTVAGYTDHNARVYKCGRYMISKQWGMFRIFKDGKEIETTLKTTSTLTDAKMYVGYLLQEDKAS